MKDFLNTGACLDPKPAGAQLEPQRSRRHQATVRANPCTLKRIGSLEQREDRDPHEPLSGSVS